MYLTHLILVRQIDYLSHHQILYLDFLNWPSSCGTIILYSENFCWSMYNYNSNSTAVPDEMIFLTDHEFAWSIIYFIVFVIA